MDDPITISDLYESAYLLCCGLRLKDVTVMGSNGRKLCTFTFDGEDVGKARAEYRQGRATVNLALLKWTMNNLKDEMFKRIREYEKKENAKCLDSKKQTRSSRLTQSSRL